ncbi:hypothetical protein N0V90_008658 [Kalmusia sp. IMI 367209]|nr:hypothetical protein N0V90_008658 [Kalmusia sp. IMI 367209]
MPNPLFHFASAAMKPGANHTPRLTNTFNDPTPRVPGSNRKIYGNKSRSIYMNLPDTEEQSVAAGIWGSHAGSPAKKRRTENAYSDQQPETIYAREDGDNQDGRPSSRLSNQTSRPVSRRSADSGRTSLSGSKGYPFSGINRTDSVAKPHSKKSRASTSQLKMTPVHGDFQSSPILLDDDAPTESTDTSRREQLQQVQQGGGNLRNAPVHHREPETVSKYFPKRTPKMNQSTYPLREPLNNAARNTSRESGDRLKKHPNMPDDSLSEDELLGPTPQLATSGPKFTKRLWPLLYARTHEYEERKSNMFLEPRQSNEYRITSPNPAYSHRLVERHVITCKKLVIAYSDNTSRVRLIGSTDAKGVQYVVDLEFAEQDDLNTFTLLLQKSITIRGVIMKKPNFMAKIFKKPLDGPIGSPTAHVSQSRDQVHSSLNAIRPQGLISTLQATHHGQGSPKLDEASDTTGMSTQRRPTGTLGRPVRNTRATHPYTVDAQEDPKEEKYSVTVGLGKPWKRQLNYGSGRRRAVVDFLDLERLDNGEFLNDQLIDFYLLFLFDQMKVPRNKVYIFNTHFFTTLTRKVPGQKSQINYKAVAKWTSRDDIFGYDYIVVPINQDIHWYLAIICNVSNISRVPAMGDSKWGRELDSESSKDPNPDPSTEGGVKVADFLPRDSTPRPEREIHLLAEDEEEETEINLVDAHADKSESDRLAPIDDSSVVQSPAPETAGLKRLGLSEPKPGGILLNSSSSVASPKRKKRKHGPPVRKWDTMKPVIIVLDSLGGNARSHTVRILKDYIREEGQSKRGMEAEIPQNACYAKDSQIPMQENLHDCGVYLLGYAQKFFENPDDFTNRLLTGEMHLETDWPDMAMPKMRDLMRDILYNLYEEQEKEHVQAKKNKKNTAVGTTEPSIEGKMAAAKTGKSLVNEDTPESATSSSDKIDASVVESAPAFLEVGHHEQEAAAQPRPRLASPFQLKPSPWRDAKSHSPKPLSTEIDSSDVPGTHSDDALSTDERQTSHIVASCRSKSRMVVPSKPPLARKSPKRPSQEVFAGNATDEMLGEIKNSPPKQLRAAGKKTARATSIEERDQPVIDICSPASNIAKSPVTRQRSRPIMQSSPRKGSSLHARGSSRDPITIEDSQEKSAASPLKSSRAEDVLDDPVDFFITSPQTENSRGSQHQKRQYILRAGELSDQSSPPIQSSGSNSLQTSPSAVKDRNSQLPRAQERAHLADDSFSVRMNARPKRGRFEVQDDNAIIIDDDAEVPETPPRQRSSPLGP